MAERKIKILHVVDSLAIGGMERVVIDVANGLDPARFAQTVCCISRRGAAADFLRAEVRCLDLAKGAQADRLMPLKLARVIRDEQPDIVHTQSWSGIDTGLARLLARAPRLVHSEHGRNYPYLEHEPLPRKLARRCLYHLADAVFAISEEVREFYCRETGFPRARVQVIPNGMDVRRIDEADAREVRAELDLAADDFVIGTVARLDATKNTITLARAFAQLRQDERDARLKLLIVGDGSERARLEEFLAAQGLQHAAIFTGLRQDVPRLLKAMNVFALPSLSEGMPITVLEAMAARLPVVATNVGALPQLVEEGITGWLVAPQQPAALAAKLSWLWQHRAQSAAFGAAGRQKVEREYGMDVMLRRYADLYHAVLRNKERA